MPINMGGHIDVMFRSTEATRTTTPGSYVDDYVVLDRYDNLRRDHYKL